VAYFLKENKYTYHVVVWGGGRAEDGTFQTGLKTTFKKTTQDWTTGLGTFKFWPGTVQYEKGFEYQKGKAQLPWTSFLSPATQLCLALKTGCCTTNTISPNKPIIKIKIKIKRTPTVGGTPKVVHDGRRIR
jgi:hypothetical protein